MSLGFRDPLKGILGGRIRHLLGHIGRTLGFVGLSEVMVYLDLQIAQNHDPISQNRKHNSMAPKQWTLYCLCSLIVGTLEL